MPAILVKSAGATDRMTRSLSPSDSSSTSSLVPARISSRRRNAAGSMISPFEETLIIDTMVRKSGRTILILERVTW